MTERKSRNCDAVDLTEDEDSSEGNVEVDSPFHFVDCSNFLNDSFAKSDYNTPAPEPDTSTSLPVSLEKNSIIITPKVVTSPKNDTSKVVERFTSVQIKPPSTENYFQNALDGKPIETVCLDSDNELDSSNHLPVPPPLLYKTNVTTGTKEITLPQTNTIYSPKQPPGKVVIIRKNNKYYKIIIPHNVMPNINQSMGPVLINIPEVGPLVISNDPQAETKTKPQQLSLNLDAVEKPIKRPHTKGTTVKDIMLRDKKFCWAFNSFRKRDLDGFCYADRFGFNKAEAYKAKKCERVMSIVLNKQIGKLSSMMREYEAFKRSLQKKDKVKLVKINNIIQGKCSAKTRVNSKRNFEDFSGVNGETSSVASDDYNSDLLITKKVVILNDESVKSVKKPGRGRPKKIQRNNRLGHRKNFNIKPCSVQIVKDQAVEKAYVKYCDEMGLKVKRKIHPDTPEFSSDHQAVRECKMVHNTTAFQRKVIKTEEKLRKEMDPFKPFLILTEQSINFGHSLEYYENESGKTNILHVVGTGKTFSSTILNAWAFVSAVKMNYVKLVSANVFSKFVKDGMQFRSDVSNYRAEHNYSYVW